MDVFAARGTSVGCVLLSPGSVGFLVLGFPKMVDNNKSVIAKYQRHLMEMPYVPAAYYERNALGDDCDVNKLSLQRQGGWHRISEGRGIASQQCDV